MKEQRKFVALRAHIDDLLKNGADVVGLGAGRGQLRRRLGDAVHGVRRLRRRAFRSGLGGNRRGAVGDEDGIDLGDRPVLPRQVGVRQAAARL